MQGISELNSHCFRVIHGQICGDFKSQGGFSLSHGDLQVVEASFFFFSGQMETHSLLAVCWSIFCGTPWSELTRRTVNCPTWIHGHISRSQEWVSMAFHARPCGCANFAFPWFIAITAICHGAVDTQHQVFRAFPEAGHWVCILRSDQEHDPQGALEWHEVPRHPRAKYQGFHSSGYLMV